MIIVDNCIISSLSKINRFDLLKYFKDVRTTNGVAEEIFRSEIDEVISPFTKSLKEWLSIVSCKDIYRIKNLQVENFKLSYVDCEMIVVCDEKQAILFSDDTDLINTA